VAAGLVVSILVATVSACDSNRVSNRRADAPAAEVADNPAPYQSEVEEGLGAAVAILVDTSGSMREVAPGETRSKYFIARDALEAMLDATDGFIVKRPDFPIKIGVYSFSSGASTVLPIQQYERAVVRSALNRLPGPGGGTAIGDGVFRKYLLVITDGENTSGRNPSDVARDIFRKSEGAVQTYFVAFDTSPEKFAFLKEVGGDVIGASNGAELRTALDNIYQGHILAEAIDAGERK
jgi:Mg-chelatase subunit ChlD